MNHSKRSYKYEQLYDKKTDVCHKNPLCCKKAIKGVYKIL